MIIILFLQTKDEPRVIFIGDSYRATHISVLTFVTCRKGNSNTDYVLVDAKRISRASIRFSSESNGFCMRETLI